MRHLRPIAAALLALGLVLSATATALAKGEDTFVTLDAPLPVDATPGSTVEIGWTLDIATGDDSTVPFNAEGVYVRLTPASGAPLEVVARQDRVGHYLASVTVPAGGLGSVVFGLRGEACDADGRCERADEYFTVADPNGTGAVAGHGVADPVAAHEVPPPVVAVRAPTAEAPRVSTTDLTWLPLVAIVGLAVVGVGLALRGRGRAPAI